MLAAGSTLGPYKILAPLGQGGMGEVYRARDSRLSREVALKVIPLEFSRDHGSVKRFEQEARAAGALNHPNVVAVHDVGVHDGSPFVVMELLEGEILRERLSQGALPVRKAIDYAAQAAHGLAAAHAKGIVHRDLKPENLFVTKDGRLKVLDFGLAKLTRPEVLAASGEQAISVAATEDGAILGTPGYMAPEQVRGESADQRSDLFALGAILYEMLTGKRAFQGASTVETLSAILNEEPPPLSASGREISAGLETVVRRCLEKEASQRFESAHDVGLALEVAAADSGAWAVTPAAATTLARHRVALVLLAVVSVLAATALLLPRLSTQGRSGRAAASFQTLTYRPQFIFKSAFGPDGKTIYFSAALEGATPEIFTIRPGHPEPTPLGLKDVHLLNVSPKEELAVLTHARYFAGRQFIGTLARLPLGGGAPREMLESVREADWMPDGNLAIIREVNTKDRLEYPIGNVLYETAGYLSDLRVSPRGDRLAFLEHPTKGDNRGWVAVVDLAGRHTRLAGEYGGEEGLAWSPGGDRIFFSTGPGANAFSVHAVSLSGDVEEVQSTAGGLTIHDVARDGRWLACRDDRQSGIKVLAPGAGTERDLSWLDFSFSPLLSSDGRMVLFTEAAGTMGKNYTVCLRSTDGSPVVSLGEGAGRGLSPDGKWALAWIPSPPQQVVLYPTGAGETRRLERGKIESYMGAARFHPDGKRVVLSGSEPGQAPRCYVQDIASGRPRPVTPEGTTLVALSPDGRLLLVRGTDQKFFIYPLASGDPRPVPWLNPEDQVCGWSDENRSLLVYRGFVVPARVERLDLASGRRVPFRQIGSVHRPGLLTVSGIAFAMEGRSYAYQDNSRVSRLFLVEHAR